MIDKKYIIIATNPTSKSEHTEEDSMLFLAKDEAVPGMLSAYIDICASLGANQEHLESLRQMRNRVIKYQIDNGSKVPDTLPGSEAERCLSGSVEDGSILPCQEEPTQETHSDAAPIEP